ncbi:MAG: methyltransferase domain-containing protein [Myxococcota bacterium]
MEAYSEEFFREQCEVSRRSAREIAPLVLEFFRPASLIDVGCGVGSWPAAFEELGVEDVWGVDGGHVDEKLLQIPSARLVSFDLSKPFRMNRKFDLVVSLEVAEHLPGECAQTFVRSLTGLGDVVLFSAAIPYQGGTNHLNEQWPDYWAGHFRERGYVAIDCLRAKVWDNRKVAWWYAQNLLIFARRDRLKSIPTLKRAFERTDASQLSLVHPRRYLEAVDWELRAERVRADVSDLVPPGESFVLVDQAQLDWPQSSGRRAIPFLERRGEYWGPPPDDATAIRELERLRESGARFVVFCAPAFWWLDHYAELHCHLRSRFLCALENDRVVAFNLCLQPEGET